MMHGDFSNLNEHQRPELIAALQRFGVSSPGVDQILHGQIVVNPADRSKLASLLTQSQTAPVYSSGFQGGCAKADVQLLGVSPHGVEQFLQGQVVLNPADRSKLASLVVQRFTPPIGSNKGSVLSEGGATRTATGRAEAWAGVGA